MNTSTATRYLLPPQAYTSQQWFDAEQEELFERTWVFVGVEHELENSGDFITATVGRAPVVVVRGEDGQIRGFHNLCRHRGLQIVDGSGNCGKGFVCPYHRWNYRSSGELRSVPQRDQYEPFDYQDMGLLPVSVSVWKTLVFVNLKSDPTPIDQWMAGLTPLLENFHPNDLIEVSNQLHEVEANWKLYVENHVDWLHLWYLHRDSLGHYDHAHGERHELGHHWASFESTDGDQSDSIGGPLIPIPGLTKNDRRNGAHFVFPSLTLFTNDGYWMLGQLTPVGPSRFTLRLRVFAVSGSDGPGFEQIVNTVMHEDYSAAESIQRAAASPAYAVGPLTSSYEREIMRFQEHYLEYVTPPG